MTQSGYYRFPTIHKDNIAFVSEDDLWTVAKTGGIARRLTSNPGRITKVAYSSDGSQLAFTGRDEGINDVYVMPALGGEVKRLTYLGQNTSVAGWTPDAKIIYYSNVRQAFRDINYLYAISPEGGQATKLDVGTGMSISYGKNGACVIGRNTTDIARWKRYKGGTTGELWIDTTGKRNWKKLIELDGNVAAPLWIGKRIYFVSDHEGTGNLYSTTPTGKDLERHTHREDFYVRHPSTDGESIVYHAGADLFVLSLEEGSSTKVELDWHSSRPERNRKFVSAQRYLQEYTLDPKGNAVAIATRGKVYTMNNWEGAVLQHKDSDEDIARYSRPVWLHDGKRIVQVSDASGEMRLELRTLPNQTDPQAAPIKFNKLDIGYPYELLPSPTKDQLAITNHRNELVLVDLENPKRPKLKVLDTSPHNRIFGMAWSPDGRWLAYSYLKSEYNGILKLCDTQTAKTYPISEGIVDEDQPSFDPEGKYLYFRSHRTFNPVYDSVHFDLGFTNATKLYLLTLQADTPSPFVLTGNEADSSKGDKAGDDAKDSEPQKAKKTKAAGKTTKKQEKTSKAKATENQVKPVQIDLEGIQDRIVAFPIPAGRYGTVKAIKGKVLFTVYPTRGALADDYSSGPSGRLEVYDFAEQNHETLIEGISDFDISQDGSTMIYRVGRSLRVLKAGEKPSGNNDLGRKGGWLDLNRIKVSVLPQDEWAQMLREAWRRQRDFFWTEDMSGVDWTGVYTRYAPLVQRVSTRSEVSDLFWEMQGELGTSHAYEYGGDYRREPGYYLGKLGADFSFDAKTDSYMITKIVRGDPWNLKASSPLAQVGLNINVGDGIVAVDGEPVSADVPIESLLVNQASNEIMLSIVSGTKATKNTKSAKKNAQTVRQVVVKTLYNERAARYRDWVEHNRAVVHAATDGRIGYLHIPDMGARGYAEFHRGLLSESDCEGLVVDVRYNEGGHVSELLLEKLARKQRAYKVPRWGQPVAEPELAFTGPMVAISNEFSGSDGDIFSHSFKLLGLGPLIGKRTWGGVVGIKYSEPFSDGSGATQPGFATWYNDVGYQVENYGTDPTIDVDIRPQDWVDEVDPQLDRGLKEIIKLLKSAPQKPDFSKRPILVAPKLPKAPK